MNNLEWRPATRTGLGHAVVIGGSMAGMLTARILSEHFDQVTIVERDRFPEAPENRKGLPQARHLHALLLRGLQIMEQLFPGLQEELLEAGAIEIDTASDFAWLTPKGWGIRFKSRFSAFAFSRDLLDWAIRSRVRGIKNINIIEESEVTGLLTSESHNIVNGVRLRKRGAASDQNEASIAADLVVEASGRSSRAPDWLEELGYGRPGETVVNAFLGYASRLYRRVGGFGPGWKGAFIQAAPPDRTRAGIIIPVEGDRWMLTLGGGDRDYPPTDEPQFLEFLRTLESQLIYDLIKNAQPLSPIYGYRTTENRRRHYEKMSRMPEGLVLVGDSVCAFNPVYGQGMTTAAVGALALDRCLREQRRRSRSGLLTGLPGRFHRRLAEINAVPWMLATGEDCRYRGTEGAKRGLKARMMHAYIDHVMALTTHCSAVRAKWFEVFHMLKGPGTLFGPAVFMRVVLRVLGFRREPTKRDHSKAIPAHPSLEYKL